MRGSRELASYPCYRLVTALQPNMVVTRLVTNLVASQCMVAWPYGDYPFWLDGNGVKDVGWLAGRHGGHLIARLMAPYGCMTLRGLPILA